VSKPIGAKPFILVCRECGDGENAKPLYFESDPDRGGWASAHTAETGHSRWLVTSTADLDDLKRRNADGFGSCIAVLKQVVPHMATALREIALVAAISDSDPVMSSPDRARWMAVFAELDDLLKGG